MDVSEYRRQMEAEAAVAARSEPDYKQALRNARSSGSGDAGAFEGAPGGSGDLSTALAILADSDAENETFTAALQGLSVEVDDHPDLIDALLGYVVDNSHPPDRRLAVLSLLQEVSFRMAGFPAKRPEYLATLRSIVEDPDRALRRVVIGILAREKDDYVQRRLVEGLEGTAKALVPAAKAIQFLAYDVHSEYFPLAKRIVHDPPSRGAKVEAIRLLAADPSAKDLLVKILGDHSEEAEARMASAVALQLLDPEEFERHATRIVLDDDEDDQLQALSLTALTHFGKAAELGGRFDGTVVTATVPLEDESGRPQDTP